MLMKRKIALFATSIAIAFGVVIVPSSNNVFAEANDEPTPITTIIEDGALGDAVCSELGKEGTGCSVTVNELSTITRLYVTSNVESLSGISHIPNLYSLELVNAPNLSDYSELATITNLSELKLGSNVAVDIEQFAPMFTHLTLLSLSNRGLTNIDALHVMSNLKELNLSYNQIQDISALESMPNMYSLNISGNNTLSNVTPLANLTALEYLDASNTQIDSSTALAGLVNLKMLKLNDVQHIDLADLSALTNLEVLEVYTANGVSDLESIAHLPLNTLIANYGQISDVSSFGTGFTSVSYLELSDQVINVSETLKVDKNGNTIDDFTNILKNVDGSPIRAKATPIISENNGVSHGGVYNATKNSLRWVGLAEDVDHVSYTFEETISVGGNDVLFNGIVNIPIERVNTNQTIEISFRGAGLLKGIEAIPGESITLPNPKPIAQGKTFAGWYEDEALTVPVSTPYYARTTDTVLYAKWDGLGSYSVKFTSYGGIVHKQLDDVIEGSLITKPVDPIREGYVFIGWYNGRTAWNFDEDIVSKNVILNAHWSPETFFVAFDTTGGTTIESEYGLSSGSLVTKPVVPEREGYQFVAWYKDASLAEEWNFETDTVLGNITLYAKWVKVKDEPIEKPIEKPIDDGKNTGGGEIVVPPKQEAPTNKPDIPLVRPKEDKVSNETDSGVNTGVNLNQELLIMVSSVSLLAICVLVRKRKLIK